MATKRLSQVLALESQAKAKNHKVISELYKLVQKGDLFVGYNKVFLPKDEESDKLEPESKPVTNDSRKLMAAVFESMSEYMDVTLTKDVANSVTEGVMKVGDVEYKLPLTFIVWLEKRLTEVKTFVENLPVLDETKSWRYDETRNIYVTDKTRTARNKKKKVPLVLYGATDKHPAQVQMIDEDIFQGNWEVEYVSTAIPRQRKEQMVSRVEYLLTQTKLAREEANSARAEEKAFANVLFNFITAQ